MQQQKLKTNCVMLQILMDYNNWRNTDSSEDNGRFRNSQHGSIRQKLLQYPYLCQLLTCASISVQYKPNSGCKIGVDDILSFSVDYAPQVGFSDAKSGERSLCIRVFFLSFRRFLCQISRVYLCIVEEKAEIISVNQTRILLAHIFTCIQVLQYLPEELLAGL